MVSTFSSRLKPIKPPFLVPSVHYSYNLNPTLQDKHQVKTGIDSSLHSRLPPQNIRTRQLYFELLLSEALRTACQFPHQTHQSHQQMKVWPSGDRAIKIVTRTATDHCWRKIMACYGMAPSNKLRYFYMCQHQVHTWYLSFFWRQHPSLAKNLTSKMRKLRHS